MRTSITDSPAFSMLTLALALMPWAADAACSQGAVVVGGAGRDPAMLWVELDGIIDRIAENHALPEEKVSAFKEATALRYRSESGVDGDKLRQEVSGRILLPTCSRSDTQHPLAFEVQTIRPATLTEVYGAPLSSQTGEFRWAIEDELEMALMDYMTICTAQ